ncbi:major facilitator superfamily domain-containing protein [Microdochium bolleyi]|uniref:Major facilitator superfamily domain-containing protein n=1 Tax=Microdochium bolleyi TaxID=196109 RepID=A0A136J2Y6_9PEZI|nr:major facilitator superfamily domain-containing protein [Microdochium bolleyi]
MATNVDRAARDHAQDSAATEQTPLLATAYTGTSPDDLRKAYRRTVLFLCFVIIFIIEIAVGLFIPASTAIAELNICHAEHPGLRDGGDYSVCKGPEVQGRLAMLQGWQLTAECIPGIIGAIPYGLLADKWGRRPVLVLSLAGYTLYIVFMILVLYAPSVFAPEVILIGPVFALIGGSTMVASAMAYTLIADVVPVEDRATVFFQFGAAFAVAELVSGPLAGAVMLKSSWLCMLLGLGLWIFANVLCCVVPETLEIRRLADRLEGTLGDGEALDDAAATFAKDDSLEPLTSRVKRQLRHSADEVRDFAVVNQGLLFLMLSLVFVVLSKVVRLLLLQFTTKKFNWSWSQGAFLLSIRSGSNLANSLFLLPAISSLLTNTFSLAPIHKDVLIARGTGVCGILGALLIALAPDPATLSVGLVVFGLAGGMAVAVRSLLNALVEPHHVGMLNTMLGLLEQVGLMVAGPLFSQALKTGIDLGGAWIGLPFLVAAAYMVVATGIVFLFRVPQGSVGGDSLGP